MLFQDRKEAGIRLAERLTMYRQASGVLVLALPRGGVVVAYEIAAALAQPLDVFIVRKIGHPMEPELAIGAIAETGTVVLNEDLIDMHRIPDQYIQSELQRQREEMDRRINLYRGGKGMHTVEDRTVLLIDDGVATGATMRAAIIALNQEKLGKLVVALPVAPPGTVERFKTMADEVVCLETPRAFTAVGSYYYNFAQVTDQEVVDLLRRTTAKAA
jgi:predicted phosphoribosyltransferase